MIRAIDRNVVNKICSGQVVLTLATAVKELVENSLDAGATNIQIKLVECGSELIEVTDNGSGVEEGNLNGLTLKHHTSKISEFKDLESVESFGFRGEALSSLCSLGNVKITTRHSTATVGTKLTFDHQGAITDRSSIARQVGTTVVIENLFYTLPVRHKEFIRNIKKEFSKLCSVLQAYSLFNQNCSITCINRVGERNRTVLDVRAGDLKERIAAIFGVKQMTNLLQFETVEPDNGILEEFRCTNENGTIQIHGYISSCASGAGRSSPDRQFFFINNRPVDSTKMSRLVNEVYHQYNPHQHPFVVANITSTGSVDVNLVPDKRQILLENENLVMATIKMSMQNLYKTIPSTLPLQLGQPLGQRTLRRVESSELGASGFAGLARFRVSTSHVETTTLGEKRPKISVTPSINEFFFPEDLPPVAKKAKIELDYDIPDKSAECIMSSRCEEEPQKTPLIKIEPFTIESLSSQVSATIDADEANEGESILTVEEPKEVWRETMSETQEVDSGITTEDVLKRRKRTWDISISEIVEKRRKKPVAKKSSLSVKFFSKIEPASNERAEEELTRELSQEAFQVMEVIGQFNRGFIITLLDNDLFIVDQHATDEKANFELLSAKKMTQQRLAVPQKLSLSTDKEELFLDKADIIRMNGFEFCVDMDARATERITLTSIPLLKGAAFDRADLDQLLFLLSEAPDGQHCRASRVRDVLASRACRMSVMIGTVLKKEEMLRLVNKMGQLHQPWNCPHGRPTIRHLLNLQLLETNEET